MNGIVSPAAGAAGTAWLTTEVEEVRSALADFPELLTLLPPAADDLEREYVRLFLRPRGETISLWQSSYEAEVPQLMGEAHDSAVAWFRRYGWETRRPNEPADHLGLLLQFFAYLEFAEPEAGLRWEFQERHLWWVPAACGRIRTLTREPFYRELAELTVRTIAPAGNTSNSR